MTTLCQRIDEKETFAYGNRGQPEGDACRVNLPSFLSRCANLDEPSGIIDDTGRMTFQTRARFRENSASAFHPACSRVLFASAPDAKIVGRNDACHQGGSVPFLRVESKS